MKNLFTVLSSLNIPFCHPPYTGNAESFLVYTLINSSRNNYMSGDAWQNETNVSIDVYSKGAYESIAESATELLRNDGCVVSWISEDYEYDTGYHHITLDVTYWEDVGVYEPEPEEINNG